MMRIGVEMFSVEDRDVLIPFNSNRYIQGAIYQAFREKFGEKEAQKIHDAYTLKPFSFTTLLVPRRRVTRNGIIARGKVYFMFSTLYDRLAEAVIDYFEPDKEVFIVPNKYRVKLVKIFEEPEFSGKDTFITVTPFIVYENHKSYSIEDPDFQIALWDIINLKTKLYGGRIDSISFDNLKKKKVKIFGEKFDAYLAKMRIEGDERGLKVLYHTGFGAKNSAGFGFLKKI